MKGVSMYLAENDSIAAVFQGHPPNACATFGQGQQQHDLYYHPKLYVLSTIQYTHWLTLQSFTGKLQGKITTQGDPCSHYRE